MWRRAKHPDRRNVRRCPARPCKMSRRPVRFREAKGVFVAFCVACGLLLMSVLALALVGHRMQEYHSFHPLRAKATPTDEGGDGISLMAKSLPHKEDVWIKTEDGLRLNAWYVPAPPEGTLVIRETDTLKRLRRRESVAEGDKHADDDPHDLGGGAYPSSFDELRLTTAKKPKGVLMVYFHGNSGNLTMYEINILNWLREGYDILMPDYRGFGLSDGSPTFAGILKDAEATMQRASDMVGGDMSKVVVVGFSMGSAAAMHSAQLYDSLGLGACVIEAGFLNMQSAALHLIPGVAPLASVLSPSLDNGAAARFVHSTPLAVVHTQEDSTTAIADASALYKAAATPTKHFFVSTGVAHTAIHSGNRVKKWVDVHRRRAAPAARSVLESPPVVLDL